MIPLNTPPGTRIVCIDDSYSPPWLQRSCNIGTLDGLKRGEYYTLKSWFIWWPINQPLIMLEEIVRDPTNLPVFVIPCEGFDPRRFRLLEDDSTFIGDIEKISELEPA